ncbi:MAG: hypothetical protein QXH99_04675 [Sulfolobales archaeon]
MTMGTYLNIVEPRKLLTTVAKIKIVLGSIGRECEGLEILLLRFIVMFLRAVCLGII